MNFWTRRLYQPDARSMASSYHFASDSTAAFRSGAAETAATSAVLAGEGGSSLILRASVSPGNGAGAAGATAPSVAVAVAAPSVTVTVAAPPVAAAGAGFAGTSGDGGSRWSSRPVANATDGT
jgi:hypothetical protein